MKFYLSKTPRIDYKLDPFKVSLDVCSFCIKKIVDPNHDLEDRKTDPIQAEKSADGRGIQLPQESNELGHDVHSQIMQVTFVIS